ncbi:MAG: hypothetical protein ACRYGP_08165 [Janthinobacterium lividum]
MAEQSGPEWVVEFDPDDTIRLVRRPKGALVREEEPEEIVLW